MRQYTETYHTLEMRRKVSSDEWNVWHRPVSWMFQSASLIAFYGRLVEAIEEAERIHIREYGNMHGVEFRCVTKSTTITASNPLNDGWNK